MHSDPLATFVTTTSFGSWLPGADRGYADNGQFMPPRPLLADHVRRQMIGDVVVFSALDQERLFTALVDACEEFAYQLTDAVVEATHLHWIIGHKDAPKTMVGRLKTRMRQRLARGRIWSADFSHRLLFDDQALDQARIYLTKHAGLRMLAEHVIARQQ
jgi:REP element-mobilizing transposase RayT